MQLSSIFQGVTYNLVVWSGAEDFIIIVCGSVPTLKPLWDRYITKTKQNRFSRVMAYVASDSERKGSNKIVVSTDVSVDAAPRDAV